MDRDKKTPKKQHKKVIGKGFMCKYKGRRLAMPC